MPPHSGRISSNIWNHFDKMDKKGKCRYCNQVISISSGTNSNLKRHLKAKHPTVPFENSIRSRSRSPSMVDEPSSQEIRDIMLNPGASDMPTTSASVQHAQSNQLSPPGPCFIASSVLTQAVQQPLMTEYKPGDVYSEASKNPARAATSQDGAFRIPTAKDSRKRKNLQDDNDSDDQLQVRDRSINTLEDPYYTYALNLANELRKYDAKTLAHVKRAIADTLFEADMGRLPAVTAESFANNLHPHQVYLESPGTSDSQGYGCPTSSGTTSPVMTHSVLPN